MRLAFPIYKQELKLSPRNYWDHNEIKQQEFIEILSKASSFKNCFQHGRNLTTALLRDIKHRTKGDPPLSIVLQIFGKQGSGKSVLAFQIAKKIDPNFNPKKVFFKYEDLLNYTKKAKVNDCLVLDEQAIEFGEGSLRQLKEIQNLEEVTRILQLHFIYCSPTLREHLAAHYTLRVIQKNSHTRVTKFAFCNNAGNYYYGYGLAKIPLDSASEIWPSYEKVKIEYAKGIKERSTQKYDVWEKAKQLKNHYLFKHSNTKAELELISQDLWPSLTLGEHKKIVRACDLLAKKAYDEKYSN